jgi:SAM-dependent methyltransferase
MISKRYKADDREVFTLFRKGIQVKKTISHKIHSGEWKLIDRFCECGKQDYEILSEKNKYGVPQQINICKNCGLIFYSPAIDTQSTIEFYQKYYNDLCSASIQPEELFHHQYLRGTQLLDFLKAHKDVVNLQNTSSILEIGTGTGGILRSIMDKYPHLKAFGTEYRDEEIAIAKNKGITAIKGDVEDFVNHHQGKIDLILLNHVMEHFIDIGGELKKIRSIMHERSILFVGVPGVLNTHKFYPSFLESISLDHNYFFTGHTLDYIMNKNGFKRLYSDEDVNSLYRLSPLSEFRVEKEEYHTVKNYLLNLEKSANRPAARLRSLYIEYRQWLKNIVLNFLYRR